MITTRGIVIHKEDFREADRIYTLYTKEFGKLKVHAKGVRKIDAKLKGHLELFNAVELGFVQGRRYPILVSAECTGSFSALRRDPPSLKSTYAMSRILNEYLKEGSPSSNIWNLSVGFLRELDRISLNTVSTGTHSRQRLLTFFILKFIRYLGLTPILDECAACGKRGIGHDAKIFFHPNTFGILCLACGAKLPRRGELHPELTRVLPLFFNKSWSVVRALGLGKTEEETLGIFAHLLIKLVL